MDAVIRLLGTAIEWLRAVFSVALIIGAVGAAAAWAERTRRVNAFGPVAKFARKVMDPLIRPLAPRVAQLGGSHASAPWWWLLAVLVFGALFIGILGFVRGELAAIYYATQGGPRGMLRFVVGWAFTLMQLAVLARVVMSWVGGNYSKFGRLIFATTEWMLAPVRRVLPVIASVDFSPIVVWFALGFLQSLVMRAL